MSDQTPSGRLHPFKHYDPSQLIYQVVETMIDRVYLRHGVDVAPGDVVFDVGANVGVAAVFFLVDCGAGLVHSFEPVEPLYELLAHNVRSFPNAVTHQLGLSSAAGTATITYYPGAAAMSGFYADATDRDFVESCLVERELPAEDIDRVLSGFDEVVTLEVEVDTVSSIVRRHQLDAIDLLKIDVEKAELDVLNGVDRGDWHRIRQVVVEVHDLAGRVGTVVRLLEGLGFRVSVDQDEPMKHTNLFLVYGIR